ncbi:hypothetical protein FDI24_gp096 [Acidovorax phage ACP17]|uniref:Uncharacterized protein n=1 Tax=Acidovorax phage ACP17 TaxID=2010329 RepID=A0A218M2V1_9CAUD|nr:hypothetical protein FDI24_gp096 [Acidovorax phage ACP17]ASD50375.1 hypothetical protein [Acidovorax phage ACP17]
MKETMSPNQNSSPESQTQLLESRIKDRVAQVLAAKIAEKLPSAQLKESSEGGADLKLLALAKSFGGKDTDYQEGVFVAEFESQAALDHFADALDDLDCVDSYEIRVQGGDGEVVSYDALPQDIRAVVIVYLGEDYIDYGFYETEDEDHEAAQVEPDQSIELNEVARRIKVNSRGTKRIKMQCQPGYKWDANNRACVKITGNELATKRKANRRAVLTKKSMGSTFKKRVVRKTKKAMRYRKALGLNT